MQLVGEVKRREPIERDLDLIRAILLKVAADPRLDGTRRYVATAADFPSYTDAQIDYHVELLIEAHYLKGNPHSDRPCITRLTNRGHDFVDNIRSETIWSAVKTRLQGLTHAALPVIAGIALAEVKQKLGLP